MKIEEVLYKLKTDFWAFINYIGSDDDKDFFEKRKEEIKGICDIISKFYNEDLEEYREGDYYKMNINIAVFPRFGKSYTFNTLLSGWLTLREPDIKIMSVSSGQTFASKNHRNLSILFNENDKFNKLFPSIKTVLNNQRELSTSSNVTNMFSTSIGGQATGIGVNVLILDDIYKSHIEAMSETENEKIQTFYNSALKSRLEGRKRMEIHIGTRWTNDELVSKLESIDFYHHQVKIKALGDNNESMYPKIISTKELIGAKNTNKLIFSSMYQQEPLSVDYNLFKRGQFMQYPDKDIKYLNKKFVAVDTADKGEDYFAAGFFHLGVIEIKGKKELKWVLEDVIFDRRPMEFTEDKLVNFCKFHKPNIIFIEENMDRSFIRNIRKSLPVKEFRSKSNKFQRIFNATTRIKTNIVLSEDGMDSKEYIDFMENVYEFNMSGKVKHDDAPDVLAMAIDMMERFGERV